MSLIILKGIPSARLYDETLKLFLSGYALQTFEMLHHYGLFGVLFPATTKSLDSKDGGITRQLVTKAFQNSDDRIRDGKTITAYFLFAALLWEPVQARAKTLMQQSGVGAYMAYQDAANDIIAKQVKTTAMPRHITMAMRDVWNMQAKFDVCTGSKPSRLLTHPRFRAGYDFLLLRSETGAEPALAAWWEKFHVANEAEQKAMTQATRNATAPGKARRKYSNRKRNKAPSTNNNGDGIA